MDQSYKTHVEETPIKTINKTLRINMVGSNLTLPSRAHRNNFINQ